MDRRDFLRTSAGAAAGLASVGSQLVGASQGFEGEAGNIGANLLGNSSQNRQQAGQVGREAGAGVAGAIGGIAGDLAGAYKPKALTPSIPGASSITNFKGRLPGAPLGPEVGY